MITEGIGQHAPMKVRVPLGYQATRQCFLLAQERSQHRGYSGGNAWQQGIKQSDREIPGYGVLQRAEVPIFVGIMGEYAAQQYLLSRIPGNVGFDTTLNDTGDFGVDLKAFGLTMQVKTRQRDSGENLVKDNRYAKAASACVFAEWTGEPVASVFLLGWLWTAEVVNRDTVPGARDWNNFAVPDSELLPMSRLGDELEAWKARATWL